MKSAAKGFCNQPGVFIASLDQRASSTSGQSSARIFSSTVWGWTAQEPADRGQVGIATVRHFEAGQAINAGSIERIAATFMAAGITFIAAGDRSSNGGEGVRLARTCLVASILARGDVLPP